MNNLSPAILLKAVLPFALIVTILYGCKQNPEGKRMIEFSGKTMGTTYTIKLIPSVPNLSLQQIHTDINKVLDQINRQMSTYNPDSEISRFNKSLSDEWFPVSSDTAMVVDASLEISKKTEGAFDITTGKLINLWGFGFENKERTVPSDNEIIEAMVTTGYEKIDVRISPPALRKKTNKLSIDLSAIAKGFAVDKTASLLDSLQITSYLIEIGGEIKSRGVKEGGSQWSIGLQLPDTENKVVHSAFSLKNAVAATSGNYRNYFEKDGRRFSHLINPMTGRPVIHQLASVTVLGQSCMLADGWATGLMILGQHKGYETAITHNIAAFFLYKTSTGFASRTTPLFDRFTN